MTQLRVDDSDYAKKYPLAFKYGALLYSYHIPENWVEIPGNPTTPLPEGWHWYSAVPDYIRPENKDTHDGLGMERYAIHWNIAVDEKLTKEDVTVEECEPKGYVWEEPWIKLNTHCYKAPYLYSAYPRRTFEPYGDKQYVTEKRPLTLVPYGCTNLRISYFPIADLQKTAKED